MSELLQALDAGGSLAVSLVAVYLMLRLDQRLEARDVAAQAREAAAQKSAAELTTAVKLVVERTRGLRVLREGRRVTVTLDPPLEERKPDD